MSFKIFCDICGKEILEKEVAVRGYFADGYYCQSCWKDEKNWKGIHYAERVRSKKKVDSS